MTPEKILKYWFEDLSVKDWWKKDPNFDQEITQKFGSIHTKATQNELQNWRSTPEGALAEVLILDQFSRNIYRNTPKAFAQDPQALCLAQRAVELGQDTQLTPSQRSFLYMPYMHSESKEVHKTALELYTNLGNKANLDYEIRHKEIIDRFGRYPHRNPILNRKSTPEEKTFLNQPGSSF